MLVIFTVALCSFMIFGNALAFLLKPNTITKNRKQKQFRKESENAYLGHLPGHLPVQPTKAGPAQPPLQRAAWLGQAGRQLLDGEHSMRATQLPAASPLPSSSC